MNILFLTNVLPFRRRNGGEVCSTRLIERLCDLADRVLLVGRGGPAGAPSRPQLEVRSLAPPATEFARMSGAQKFMSLAGALAAGEAWTTHRMSAGVMQALRRSVDGEAFDCVFIDHLQIYKWYQALELAVPAVLVAHNVEHQVYGDLLQRSSSVAARWVLAREQRLLYSLDGDVLRNLRAIACLTEADRAYYVERARRMGKGAEVAVLPSYFEGVRVSPRQADTANRGPDHPRRIGILGTWTWESNRLGVEWFLRDVLPHIDGDYEIVIAGRGLQADKLPRRVTYLGFVESAEDFYRSLDVVAIPSTAGGGVQEKTIEAIGHGIPVVATPVAVRGLLPCPSHLHVTNSPEAFAAACCAPNGFDPATARAEAQAWNGERRMQYMNAIQSLLAAATYVT